MSALVMDSSVTQSLNVLSSRHNLTMLSSITN